MKNALSPFIWAIFPVGFVAMWIFVCFVISLAGWRTLSGHFPADFKPVGYNFPMQGAEIGGAQYNGCLSLVVAETGLWMRPWIPFRAFHPPLLVPWNAFETPILEKRFWVQQWVTQIQTPNKKRIKIYFSQSVGKLIAERVQTAKTAPQASSDESPWG